MDNDNFFYFQVFEFFCTFSLSEKRRKTTTTFETVWEGLGGRKKGKGVRKKGHVC